MIITIRVEYREGRFRGECADLMLEDASDDLGEVVNRLRSAVLLEVSGRKCVPDAIEFRTELPGWVRYLEVLEGRSFDPIGQMYESVYRGLASDRFCRKTRNGYELTDQGRTLLAEAKRLKEG